MLYTTTTGIGTMAVPCLVCSFRECQTVRLVHGPTFCCLVVYQGCRCQYFVGLGREIENVVISLSTSTYTNRETDMQNARKYALIHYTQQQYTEQYNKHTTDKSFQVGQQAVSTCR